MAEFDANFMQGPMDEIGMVKLSGSIERVIYANDENGYAISISFLCIGTIMGKTS